MATEVALELAEAEVFRFSAACLLQGCLQWSKGLVQAEPRHHGWLSSSGGLGGERETGTVEMIRYASGEGLLGDALNCAATAPAAEFVPPAMSLVRLACTEIAASGRDIHTACTRCLRLLARPVHGTALARLTEGWYDRGFPGLERTKA